MSSNQSKGAILFSSTGFSEQEWVSRIKALAPDRDVFTQADPSVEYAFLWKHPHGQLNDLPNLKVLFSLGAGVDHILSDKDIPDLPIVRAISDDLTARMSEFIIWQVLDHHRHGSFFRQNQLKKNWSDIGYQPAAHQIKVGILGLGELGRDAALKLKNIGFDVSGWSQSQKQIENVACFAGHANLPDFLKELDILVCLLPHTPQTENILDHKLFAHLKASGPLGAPYLINAGRGALQNEDDIFQAVTTGALSGASLDVFQTEPLAHESPFWEQANIKITPHIAADSDPDALLIKIMAQIENYEAGKKLVDLVDLIRGY